MVNMKKNTNAEVKLEKVEKENKQKKNRKKGKTETSIGGKFIKRILIIINIT